MNMFALRLSAAASVVLFLKEPGATGPPGRRTEPGFQGAEGHLTGPPLYHCGLFTTDVIGFFVHLFFFLFFTASVT